MANDAVNRFDGETSVYPPAKIPLAILHVDHFGPLTETPDNYKHVFLVVDAFSRFTWLYPTKSTSSKEAII